MHGSGFALPVPRTSVQVFTKIPCAVACSPDLPLVCPWCAQDSPLLTSMHGRVQQFQSELRGRAGASLLAAGGAPREPEAPPLQGTSALLKSLHADVAADTTGSDPSAGGSPGEGERKVPGGRVPEEDYFRSDGASREGPREEQGAPGTEGAGEEGNERGGGEGNVREGNKGEEGEGALGGEGGQAAGAGQDVDGAELGDRRSAESGGRKEWQGPESADVEAEASRMGHEASDPAVGMHLNLSTCFSHVGVLASCASKN